MGCPCEPFVPWLSRKREIGGGEVETPCGVLLGLELTERERRLLDLILTRASSVAEEVGDDDVTGFAQLPAPIGADLVTATRLRQASGTLNLL